MGRRRGGFRDGADADGCEPDVCESHQFEYGSGGGLTTGEMTKVTLPYGATLRREFRDFGFVGNRVTREITARYLKTLAAGAETSHVFTRDDVWPAG